jgi:signal peptidase II
MERRKSGSIFMSKISGWFQSIWIVLLVAGIVIALDQWTKEWVRQTIPKFSSIVPIEALDPYFVFEHVDNYGAAFGLFQGGGLFFTIVALIVTVAILVYAATLPQDKLLVRILLGLQMGGALGNVIDRVNQGYVTDFIKMGVPGVYFWPNYNIADIAIVTGVIGLAVYIIAEDIREQRAQRAAEASATAQPSNDA